MQASAQRPASTGIGDAEIVAEIINIKEKKLKDRDREEFVNTLYGVANMCVLLPVIGYMAVRRGFEAATERFDRRRKT